jgi:ribosomal protein L37E
MSTTMIDALTAADRCDRCGARAYLRVTLPSGELLFCAHHGRAHSDKLKQVALQIHDETDRIHNA